MRRLSVLALALVAGSIAAQTSRVSGTVIDAAGRPVAGIVVYAEKVDDAVCCGNPFAVQTSARGSFTFDVPSGIYAITADPLPPRGLARIGVDARTGHVERLQLRLPSSASPFVPDDPPKAAWIHLGTPNANGETMVTGDAGAVPGGTTVILIAMRSGALAMTKAAADGSFQGTIHAPYGTWIMIKHDPVGATAARIRGEFENAGEGTPGPLPGTMLRVTDPSWPAGAPFGDEGFFFDDSFWRVEGSLDRTQIERGDLLTATVRFVLESPSVEHVPIIRMTAHLDLERLSGAGVLGSSARAIFTSSIMTPTGFPIEKGPDGAEAGGFVDFSIHRVAAGRAEGSFEISMVVPNALPDGHYRPFLRFDQGLSPSSERRRRLKIDKPGRQGYSDARLPLVVIGDPPPPRLPIVLFGSHVSGASQGLRALEDYAAFGFASRIALPSDRFVIPRIDALSAEPLIYRIEPEIPWVSVGDRGVPPDTPLVPFRFPSGSLTVRIEHPSGAVETLGPAPFVQSRTRAITDRHGGMLSPQGGSVTEPYQLSTMDPRFEVSFAEEGLHRIRVEMTIEDERGVTWSGRGTYEVDVARVLSIDSTMLPGTPLVSGSAFNLGGVLHPPTAANVDARIRFAPRSDVTRLVDQTFRMRSNRFGVFSSSQSFVPEEPGEYRIDLIASGLDGEGRRWSGTRTWGGIVAPPEPAVVARGQRGIDDLSNPRPQWFVRDQTNSTMGPTHVFLPLHSGDVQWLENRDSVRPNLTFQDPAGTLLAKIRPLVHDFGFDDNAAIGETPLIFGRIDGLDTHVDAAEIDLWGYSYVSVQRPLVRVREQISDRGCVGCYWRFDEQYAKQHGVGRNGDLPNDFKFQFGGVVLRGPLLGDSVYAAYASLFVLVSDDDPLGTRVFPPFQGNGGGPDGGPLFTLESQDIDLFFHPTAVRPGTILHRGAIASFAGYSAPTVPSKIEVVVTSPSGRVRTISGQANRIGYFYDPSQDFTVGESGVWRVRVRIFFDGRTSAGQVTEPFPAGDVLGSRSGEFYFYVVDPTAPPFAVNVSSATLTTASTGVQLVRAADGPVTFTITPPPGLTNREVYTTTTMPGFILEERKTTSLQYIYDAQKLAKDFPNLDLHDADGFAGADTITISFLLSGTDGGGKRRHFARQIVIQGEELQMPEQKESPPRRRSARL